MNAPTNQENGALLASLIQRARRDGPRQYARWDGPLFEEIASHYLNYFAERIAQQHNSDAILTATILMIKEAIGLGYVRSDELYHLSRQNLLAYVLFDLILFRTAGKIDEEEQLPLMAEAWNLCEQLLQSPQWMQQLLHARRSHCPNLKALKDFMTRTLAPVVEPQGEASWQGPFDVEVLDTFDINNGFLPGRMHFVAPSVLCIHDARRDEYIGAILKHSRPSTLDDSKGTDDSEKSKSEFIGETGCMGPSIEADDEAPTLHWHKDAVDINGQRVVLKRMGHRARHAVSHAGFVAIALHNSQRIWIVKTP